MSSPQEETGPNEGAPLIPVHEAKKGPKPQAPSLSLSATLRDQPGPAGDVLV